MKILTTAAFATALLVQTTFSAIQGPDYDDIRAMGMGNTVTPVTTDRTAIFHNPAGLAFIKDKFQCSFVPVGIAIDGAFSSLVAEMINQGDKLSDLNKVDQDFLDMISEYDGNWAGFSYIPEITLATKRFGFGMYSVLPIGVMIESGHLIPKLALRAERDIVVTTSFGIPFKEKHAIGASLKYIQRTPLEVEITKYSETFKLFDEISSGPLGIVGDYSSIQHGVTLDVGLMHNFLPGFRFAWSVKDLIGAIGGEYIAPPRLNLGCSYFFPQLDHIETIRNLIIAFEITNLFGIEKKTEEFEHFAKKIHIGAELDLNYAALRLGVSQGYPTIGVGLKFGLFKADYAFFTEELGYYPGQFPNKKHIVSLGVEITTPKKKSQKMRMGPNDLYNRAKALFAKENYYDAMTLFARILVEYPDFFKSDVVNMHIAQSQEYLNMQQAAKKTYEETIKKYPKSPILPYIDLGLLRIAYRDSDSSEVSQYYGKLDQASVKDSLRHHANYYKGQQLIKQGQFEKAIHYLEKIPQDHNEFLFAQHSMGIAYASMDSLQTASIHLLNSGQLVPRTKAEVNIAHKSMVLLGYIFYEGSKTEEGSLPKAVAALRRIPDTSYYYEDALLGLGWCGIAASRAEDCITACQKLRTISNKKVIQAESLLLEAYANSLQKKPGKAKELINQASKLIGLDSTVVIADSSASVLSSDYKNTKNSYNELAHNFTNLIMKKQNRDTRKMIDSLRVPQKTIQNRLLELTRKKDELERVNFFARNIKQVRADLNWAQIKTENILGIKKQERIVKKAQKDAENIDAEMEKIQNELNELKAAQEKSNSLIKTIPAINDSTDTTTTIKEKSIEEPTIIEETPLNSSTDKSGTIEELDETDWGD